jgi:L-ascorbate metabolism protein UlaG (beta-lactamase superfamily)
LVSSDVALVVDPYPDAPGVVEADIVAITNDGPNHSAQELVAGDPKVIDGPGQYEVLGYNITGIGTALSDAEAGRKVNTVYVIRAEGLAVCHLGVVKTRLAARQLDALGAIDVLIAPAGGGRALDPSDVARLINVLNPRIVVPVHYGEEGDDTGMAPISTLLGHLNVEAPDPQTRLNVTRTNLPLETRVAVLQRRAR